MRADPPAKTQDITIKVGYRLDPEDDDPIESRQIRASIKTSAGTFSGGALADAPQGVVTIPIPGVKNLAELEVISASVTIEEGNQLEGSATVPKDPVVAFLESVGVQCEYLPDSSSAGNDIFRVTSSIYLVRAVSGEVAGTASIVGGSGKAVPLSFASGATVATVVLGEVAATVGSAIEVEASLSKNGEGTLVGAGTAEKLEVLLNSFDLDVVRKGNATATSFATYEVMGQIQAVIPYKDENANWKVAEKSGSLVVPKESGMATFNSGGMPLKPGSLITGSVELIGGGSLEASAVVPDDEVNSLSSVGLVGTPDGGTDLNGTYTLKLSLSGVIPRGEGAEVSLSGPVDVSNARLEGHGGSLELVVASGRSFPPGKQVVVAVTIDGGNQLEAIWQGPPALPVEEEGDEEELPPESESARPPPIPIPIPGPPPLPPWSATDGGTDATGEEDDEKEPKTLKAELVEPSHKGVRQGVHWIRMMVKGGDGSPASGSFVTVEIAENENWLDGLGGKVLSGQPMIVGEDGMVEFEYETGEFALLPDGNSLTEEFLVYQEIESAAWSGNESEFR